MRQESIGGGELCKLLPLLQWWSKELELLLLLWEVEMVVGEEEEEEEEEEVLPTTSLYRLVMA